MAEPVKSSGIPPAGPLGKEAENLLFWLAAAPPENLASLDGLEVGRLAVIAGILPSIDAFIAAVNELGERGYLTWSSIERT